MDRRGFQTDNGERKFKDAIGRWMCQIHAQNNGTMNSLSLCELWLKTKWFIKSWFQSLAL